MPLPPFVIPSSYRQIFSSLQFFKAILSASYHVLCITLLYILQQTQIIKFWTRRVFIFF